ncbi:Bug family tripartite tricarboxylate transporter substrate binding protein [Herbaspirillum sp. GCM10030257]|uniref:Bug family tripartite tricarboxylate transporter substrate binding protein n=1 Tax=Herbaspirillum sp. GCM10030257 TaxID=3273393 RepID=UPI00360948E7
MNVKQRKIEQVSAGRRLILLGALILGLAPQAALAQTFPDRLVTIVVPGPPGSSVDASARAVAQSMSKSWKVPVVIENRPGASATLGTAVVARAAADGHTLLYTFTPFVQAPHIYKSLSYDPVKSFVPVIQTVNAPLWLGVNASLPARSVKEFVALAKAAPGKITYATPGAGSTAHLFGTLLARTTSADMLHVPYKGVPPGVLDVSTGLVSSLFASYSDLASYVQSGKIRLLASTGTHRSTLTPDILTMKEAGFPGFEAVGFGGFFAPAGTPASTVKRIADTVAQAMAQKEIQNQMVGFGLEPVTSSPAEFDALVKAQLDLWKQIIINTGVKLE